MNISHKTILAYLEDLAALEPGRKLLGRPGRWLDASKVLAIVSHVGASFRRIGLQSGARVALRAQRSLGCAIVLMGLRAVGAVAVLCDPRQDVSETLRSAETPIPAVAAIEQTGRTTFCFSWLDGGAPRTIPFDLLSLAPSAGAFESVDAAGPAFVIFTSGSTGKSKAVVLSETNLVNNLIDSQPLGDYRDDDLALGALPLHHVFGLVLLVGALVLGYGVFFPEKTDVPSILAAIQAQRLTRMNGVPALYLAMAEQREGYDLSSLRAGFIGGGAVTREQFIHIESALDMTLIPVYGMSECVGIACARAKDPREIRAAGVGPFYAMNTGKILREDGAECGPMETGEICVNGPSRMIGYYGRPMGAEEFLRTGDLGYLDESGALHLTGRKKDIIIRNGNNLSPRKIEQAILSVPGVRAAVVVGLPDERQGEVPAAMVVAEERVNGLDLSVPKNEIPVMFRFVESLPMTSSGKPDRQRIREALLQCRIG